MSWWKRNPKWKFIWALALAFMLCGHETAHVEPMPPDYGPTTVFNLQASGANTPNVSAGTVSNHAWITR